MVLVKHFFLLRDYTDCFFLSFVVAGVGKPLGTCVEESGSGRIKMASLGFHITQYMLLSLLLD